MRDNFEVNDSELRLKANEKLAIETIKFVVSAELTNGSVAAMPSEEFSLIIVDSTTIVALVVGTPATNLVSIEIGSSATPKFANLVTKDQKEKEISVDRLRYVVALAKQGSANIDVKTKFEVVNGLLRLKTNQILTAGDIKFVVSVQLGSVLAKNYSEFIVPMIASLTKINSLILAPVSDLQDVLVANTKSINLATIGDVKDQRGTTISASALSYTVETVTIESGSTILTKANLGINRAKTKVQLKAHITLPAGTYTIGIKATHSNGTAKTKTFTIIISATKNKIGSFALTAINRLKDVSVTNTKFINVGTIGIATNPKKIEIPIRDLVYTIESVGIPSHVKVGSVVKTSFAISDDKTKVQLKPAKALPTSIYKIGIKATHTINKKFRKEILTFSVTNSPVVATVIGISPTRFFLVKKGLPFNIIVTRIVTTDQRGETILSTMLTYRVISATRASEDISAKFDVHEDILRLKKGQTLAFGNIKFVISAQLKSGGEVVNSTPFTFSVTKSLN